MIHRRMSVSVKPVLGVSTSEKKFQSATQCKEPLCLVHSDVCGKMNAKSLEELNTSNIHR